MTTHARRRPVRQTAIRAAAALLATAGGLSAAHAQALKQVPADALVVVKVNHLDDVNTKVAALLQQLGVGDLAPQAKDPLKAFTEQTGIPAASLDGKRDAAFFMPNVPAKAGDAPAADDEEQPPAVVLLPVTDYAQFIGALTGAKTEGEVTTGRFKDAPEDTFVAHWGDYAAITPRKELLAIKHEGLAPTGAAGRELDQRDLSVYVNFPVLKQVLAPQLAKGKTKAREETDKKLADADAAKKELAHAALDQGFNIVESFLRDAEPTTMGLTFGKAGVSADMVVAFTKGSYLGNLFGQMKGTGGPLLGGLPDEKYLFFAGSVQDPAMSTKLLDDVLGPVAAKLGALGENGAKLQQLLTLVKSAAASSDGASAGMIVPTAALGQGSLVRFVSVVHGDAEKLRSAQEQMAEMQSGLMAGFGVQGVDVVKSTVTKNVKTVAGVSFDQLKGEIDPAANNGQAAQMQQMMQYVYGPEGQTQLMGVVNDRTLVQTMGIDDALLATIVESAKGNKDALSAQVKAVDAELPKTRSAVAYVDLAQFFSTGLSYAHAMGMNLPVQLPPNLPPVGMSFGPDPDAAALRFDGFVPTSLMQSLVQAGFQIYLNIPHGGGGM